MGRFTGDIQILLYVPPERFEACRSFYERLLDEAPYYTWNEGPEDRGAKFHAGRGTISVLCQAHTGTPGPAVINLETDDVDGTFSKVRDVPGIRIVQEPFTKPYGTRYFHLLDPCDNQINVYRLKQ